MTNQQKYKTVREKKSYKKQSKKKSRKKVNEVFDLKRQNMRLNCSRGVLFGTIEELLKKLLRKDRNIEVVKNICNDIILQIVSAERYLKEIDPDFAKEFIKTIKPLIKDIRSNKKSLKGK